MYKDVTRQLPISAAIPCSAIPAMRDSIPLELQTKIDLLPNIALGQSVVSRHQGINEHICLLAAERVSGIQRGHSSWDGLALC